MREKSLTDIHWDERAKQHSDYQEVNIGDIQQRELENDFILRYLQPGDRVLEVGCGNGFSTKLFRENVAHIDAFDFSEEMISKARQVVGEKNNRFFYDDVLNISSCHTTYNKVICVRVLINLRNLDEQRVAIKNIVSRIELGGMLLMVEGFEEGFKNLSSLRCKLGLNNVVPARINFYSSISDIESVIHENFDILEDYHLGFYDIMTRVLYPMLINNENVVHNTTFHEKMMMLAREFNPDDFKIYSRLRCLALKRVR